jgi:hypothetical protein
MITTSSVFTEEQFRVIKELARKRVAEGKMDTVSASAIVREAVDRSMPEFLKELGERR